VNPLLLLSASELARRIRAGDVRAREVVEAHIARIEEVNGSLNALVHARFAAARREADAADQRLAEWPSLELPPLFGVPFTVKESFAVEAMRQTGGLWSRREFVASEDAPTVARLRTAGAIPLGVTNVPELCFWLETNNAVYGRTNNAYDRARTAGGSSGGEGAVVGAGGSPFGLGSDIAGSIRLPAFFNGVFGHKPSAGVAPAEGHFPAASGEAERFVTAGPIARRAEDLMPLLRVLSGDHASLRDPRSVRIGELSVVSIEGDGEHDVHPELVKAQRQAADALARTGARVRVVTLPALRRSFEMYVATLRASSSDAFGDLLSEGKGFRSTTELVRWALGKSRHTLPAIGVALVEPMGDVLDKHMRPYVSAGQALRAELSSLLGPNGVLLYPSYTEPAPRHAATLFPPGRFAYTAILNVLGLPVTQVPLGLSRDGLPLGVQVVAQSGRDHVTIEVAEHIESVFGGWVPP
jgi:fatty acid amide hydrolase 2